MNIARSKLYNFTFYIKENFTLLFYNFYNTLKLTLVVSSTEDGTDGVSGSGGVVPSAAQFLLRGPHHQHDLLLGGRPRLLCPDTHPPTWPDRLGDCQEEQLAPVSGPGSLTKA